MDVFRSMQETLQPIIPVLLAAPGFVLAAAGLMLWLGGLRFCKALTAFAAAAAGLACAWVFTNRQLVPMLCLGTIPALMALFLDKPVVVVLGASLAAMIVLVMPMFIDAAMPETVNRQMSDVPTLSAYALSENITFVEDLTQWAVQWLGTYWDALPSRQKWMAAIVWAAVAVTGCFAWRWVCALTCSTLGTGMIAAGMVLLILSKGPQTMSYIERYALHIKLIVPVMIAAGTLANRWLCPVNIKTNTKSGSHSETGDGK